MTALKNLDDALCQFLNCAADPWEPVGLWQDEVEEAFKQLSIRYSEAHRDKVFVEADDNLSKQLKALSTDLANACLGDDSKHQSFCSGQLRSLLESAYLSGQLVTRAEADRRMDAGHLAAKDEAIAHIANAAYRLIDATSTFDHPDMPAHVAKDYVKRMEYPETALRAALSMFNCRPGSALTKRDRAKLLHGLARQLSAEAHAERPLPEHWEVGQKVRYLVDKEWCCDAGETGVIVAVSDECVEKPASEYQVFWTLPDKYKDRGARFWTTPGDVELVK